MNLPTYRELYYRWEHEQWAAGEIDLTVDADQWRDLSEDLRRSLLWQLSSFYVSDARMTEALVPYIDAAPTEEQQVFLSSQLVDAARHLVFFDRVLDEVVGEGGDMTGRLNDQPQRLNEGARVLLTEMLPGAATKITTGENTADALVEGIVLQHLVIEGTVTAAARRHLMEFLGSAGLLPGVRQGLAAIAADSDRHLDFALRFLKEAVDSDGRFAEVVRSTLTRNPVGWSVFKAPNDDSTYFEPLPYSADDVISAAQVALDDNLRVIGVDLAA